MALELNKIRSSQINEKVNVGTKDSPILKYDIIYPETRADLVKETFGAKAALWEPQKSYLVGDNVYVVDGSGAISSYECIAAHTSGNSFTNSNEWVLIVSRRFVTPSDEIAWRDGGSALKFKGAYSSATNYKQHDLVVYKNGETGQEEYFISLKDDNIGVAPSFEGHNDNWRNLNLWATHAADADKIKVQSAPALSESQDNVYLTFVTSNQEDASLFTEAQLVYEVNSKYLHVMSEYADKYMRSFNSDGDAVEPVAKSINDEFKAVYATIKSISGGDLVLGHSLTIQLNGETLLDNWMATTDANINIELDSSDITDWETAMTEAFNTIGNARYVRYDAAQSLTDAQKNQARLNINAAPAANYPVMDENNKIKLENLPDTVVGGLQYKGTYDASVAGSIKPEMGDYYIVSVAGNYDPAGQEHVVVNNELTYFLVGDWAIYNGESEGWAKIDNTDAVKTVNGQIGAVQTYKGVYSEEENYYAGDWVLVNGILYLAIQNSKGQSIEDAAYWQVAGRIYEGEKGIAINGNKIGHSNELTTEAAEEVAIAAKGGQFSIDANEYDEQGHVVKTKKQNITLSQTWREVKVGETTIVAKDSDEALNVVGNAPIAVEGDAAAHSIYVKHNEGTEVKDAINLSVEANGQVIANIVSSDKFGHVNGTRELKLANLALKDGDQTLSGAKTYKNNNGSGSVILPEATEVYDLGSTNAKFANIFAVNFNGALKGNADTASKWLNQQALTIRVDAGLDRFGEQLRGTEVSKNVDGSSSVNWNVSLPDSGVAANAYSVVQVNSKGIVVAGAQMIEFGKEVNAGPSDSLAVGGLFFRMVESN